MKKRVTKRYSEAFKRQVVSEYEDGQSAIQMTLHTNFIPDQPVHHYLCLYLAYRSR